LSLVFQISAVGVFIAGLMLFFIRPKNVNKDLNINE